MIQLTLTLKMTTIQVVETSFTVNNDSPIQDYVHPDDHTQLTYKMIPGFKPFTFFFFFGDNKIWMCNVLEKDESLKVYCLLPLRWCKVLGYQRKQKYISLILLCLHNWPIYTNMLKILRKRRSSQYAKQCMRSYWKFVAHSSLGFVFLTPLVHLLLSMH